MFPAKIDEKTIQKIVIFIVIAIVIIWVYRISKSFLKGLEAGAATAGEISSLPPPSLTASQIRAISNKLFKHMDGPSSITDARIVEQTFNEIPTKRDLLEVIKDFGCRKSSWGFGSCETLPEWLQSETLVSISKINSILQAKGIDYSF
jgi:hypothetical protein